MSENTEKLETSTPEERLEAAKWKWAHRKAFIAVLDACTNVQTLRALAHRLGYQEGT